jgi:glucose-1-phosphate thymidylyltransferase
MLGGVREFVVVSSPSAIRHFEDCLGDGSDWGLRINYAIQPRPEGIAQVFLVAEKYVEGRASVLVLGDNIFYGAGLPDQLARAGARARGATIFPYFVADPQALGVVELDRASGRPVALHEKPMQFRSNWAVPGLYYYDDQALGFARALKPGARGELEITDLNRIYLERGELHANILGRGVAWLDGGTHEDLFAAGQLVQTMETRTGLKVACPEEVAYRMGYITLDQLAQLADRYGAGSYADYMRTIVRLERDTPGHPR